MLPIRGQSSSQPPGPEHTLLQTHAPTDVSVHTFASWVDPPWPHSESRHKRATQVSPTPAEWTRLSAWWTPPPSRVPHTVLPRVPLVPGHWEFQTEGVPCGERLPQDGETTGNKHFHIIGWGAWARATGEGGGGASVGKPHQCPLQLPHLHFPGTQARGWPLSHQASQEHLRLAASLSSPSCPGPPPASLLEVLR